MLLTHLILITLCGRYCHCSHFTDEEIEAQGQIASQYLTPEAAIKCHTLQLLSLRLSEQGFMKTRKVWDMGEAFMRCSSGRAPLRELCP